MYSINTYVDFTQFLHNECESKFPQFPYCEAAIFSVTQILRAVNLSICYAFWFKKPKVRSSTIVKIALFDTLD